MPDTASGSGETLDTLLRRIRGTLSAAGIVDAALDARLIVEHATSTDRMDLIRDPRRDIAHREALVAQAMLERRLAGEPVHRILGHREFYGLTLALSADTLEPRPDTEALVDLVLPQLREVVAQRARCRVLDMGTGTGAIALALLSQIPGAHAVASDIAAGALEMARRNAEANGFSDRFRAVRSDWFDEISGRYDAILSNPPYVTESEYETLSREVKDHDPARALLAGADGLDAYRAIAAGAAGHLEPGGLVGLEIGASQRMDVTAVFESAGFALMDMAKDLGGRDRALLFGLRTS